MFRYPGTLLSLVAGLCFVQCEAAPEIRNTDPRISMRSGRLYFQEQPFSGVVRQAIPAMGETRETPYQNGLMHGVMIARHISGQALIRGAYNNGEKNGVHRSWFLSGKDRSYAEFRDGQYVNERWSWHANGQVAEFARYTADGRLLVSKKWRSNGLIYMNMVYSEGRALGMPGSKVCDPVGKSQESNQSNQSSGGERVEPSTY